jgi:hypothetical protein
MTSARLIDLNMVASAITPSTSASIGICSTASATVFKKSPSPLYCKSSPSTNLFSVIYPSLGLGLKSCNSTLAAIANDLRSLTRAPCFHVLEHRDVITGTGALVQKVVCRL